jgi:YHS domain-containing protein
MLRAVELLVTLAVIILIARVVLTGIMKGIASASSGGYSEGSSPNGSARPQNRRTTPEPKAAGLLHRDPVCGTFVAESTRFRRQIGPETFFYCSETCQQQHALAAK